MKKCLMKMQLSHFRAKNVFAISVICGLMLAGCGGGGSGGSDPIVSNPPPTTNPPPPPSSRGPSPPPAPDFTEGTRDTTFMADGQFEQDNGGASIVDTDTLRYEDNRFVLGSEIEETDGLVDLDYFDLNLAPREVRQAWREGWTGQGSSVLIVDAFRFSALTAETHGFVSLFSVLTTGNGASLYALTAPVEGQTYGADGGVRAAFNAPANPTSFHVVNASFGGNPQTDPAQRAAGVARAQGTLFFRDMKGLGGAGTVLGNRAVDAVLTKAAGNNGMDAGIVPDNLAFVEDDSIGPRVLIVGALTSYYNNDNPAQIASGSNRAGSNAAVRARFLVDFGGQPFVGNVFIGDPQGIGVLVFPSLFGTSFAAPRVAGYAAIVRHKFPRLTGSQTATILLDTATYQGLACFPNCAASTYGQGRVDIGRALAPVVTSGQMR